MSTSLKYLSINNEIDNISLPKGLKRWLDTFLFKDSIMGFFYTNNGFRYIDCEHCGKSSMVFKYSSSFKCHHCHRDLKVRFKKLSGYFSFQNYFSILQKFSSGYVERRFRVVKNYENYTCTYIFKELERYICDFDFNNRDYYHIYNDHWNHGTYRTMNFYLPVDLNLYSGNLISLFNKTKFKYSGLYNVSKNVPINSIDYLYHYKFKPQLEFLSKFGFYDYIYYILIDFTCIDYLDFSSNNMLEFFKLKNKLYLKYLLDNKLGSKDLQALQYLQKYNLYPSTNNYYLQFTNAIIQVFDRGRMDILDMVEDIGFKTLYNYIFFSDNFDLDIFDSSVLQYFIRDYYDYYLDCKYLKLDMSNTMYSKPKDFYEQHIEFSRRVQELKNLEFTNTCRSVLEDLQYMNYSDDKYSIIVPKTAEDIQQEGVNQCNCVGGYVKRIANGKSIVVFLRKNSDISKSYYTVEINPLDFSVVQCRDYKNLHTGNKSVNCFLDKWKKFIERKRVELCC